MNTKFLYLIKISQVKYLKNNTFPLSTIFIYYKFHIFVPKFSVSRSNLVAHSSKEAGVLSQSSNTASEANNKRDGSCQDKDEGWVEGNVGQTAHIAKCFFLRPGPDAHSCNAQTHKLKRNCIHFRNDFNGMNKSYKSKESLIPALTQKMTLKPKITYFKQQLTSL